MNNIDVKGSVFAVGGSTLSAVVGWLHISTLLEAIVIAVISTIVGFYTGKLITKIDKKIKDWFIKRKRRKKA